MVGGNAAGTGVQGGSSLQIPNYTDEKRFRRENTWLIAGLATWRMPANTAEFAAGTGLHALDMIAVPDWFPEKGTITKLGFMTNGVFPQGAVSWAGVARDTVNGTEKHFPGSMAGFVTPTVLGGKTLWSANVAIDFEAEEPLWFQLQDKNGAGSTVYLSFDRAHYGAPFGMVDLEGLVSGNAVPAALTNAQYIGWAKAGLTYTPGQVMPTSAVKLNSKNDLAFCQNAGIPAIIFQYIRR